jgi:LCP family protein required for cell wall assembly
MKLRSPAALLSSIHIPWRRITLFAAFLITLLVTVVVASTLMNLLAPVAAEDSATINTMLTEINRVTSAVDSDLSTLGFTPEGEQAAAIAAAASPQPAASPTKGVTGAVATTTTAATATVTQQPTPALPAWDRKGRVNILLMGLDGLASQGRYRRADSLIVASFDPATNSAVLIGIPRDVYVTIHSPKGDIRNRINTAYVWGELYNYPGGGPALQMRTVGELLGIPIHNYVSVYFDGFSKLIDAIGGIDINVPTAIRDNFTGWSFNTGMQHMDGKRALQYARSRYSTSDFSRGRRQQLVILAAIEKITKAGMLPRLPIVLPTVTEAFRSDMSIPELLSLASLGYKIDRAQIKTAQVDETMVQSWRTPDGAAVLLPRMDRIKPMVAAALQPAAVALPTPTQTTATADTTQPVVTAAPAATDYRTEGAKIEILNGTNTKGLAGRTQTWMTKEGFQITRIGDASGIYKQTVIYSDGLKPATRDALAKLLNVAPQNLRSQSGGGVNIRIVLGADARIP